MPYKDPERQKAAQRKHYLENKTKTIERSTKSRQARRGILVEYVRSVKQGKPCADCGDCFHYAIMEFDHIRGVKVGNVATLVREAVPLVRIKEEIAKCELVCANCHRLRTWSRRGDQVEVL